MPWGGRAFSVELPMVPSGMSQRIFPTLERWWPLLFVAGPRLLGVCTVPRKPEQQGHSLCLSPEGRAGRAGVCPDPCPVLLCGSCLKTWPPGRSGRRGQKGKGSLAKGSAQTVRESAGISSWSCYPCPTFRSITNTGKFTCDDSLSAHLSNKNLKIHNSMLEL